MAIKIKCSECKKMKWMNKNAVTCGNTCRSKRHRRHLKLRKEGEE